MIRAKWVVRRPSAEGHHERIIGDLGSLDSGLRQHDQGGATNLSLIIEA